MKIELSQPFAANGKVDEFDVKQMKKALNRLGYYQPYEKVGITGIADMGVFDALKAFQKDHGLTATGTAKPDDETVRIINIEASKTPNGQYIWRTVEDEKVRRSHAEFNRTVRDWSDDPDPGEEFNCRCWVEPVPDYPDAISPAIGPFDILAGGIVIKGGLRIGIPIIRILQDILRRSPKLNARQSENLARFLKKIPANSRNNVKISRLSNGSVKFAATSPGKVPGSKAVYEKIVDSQGRTIRYTKTTYDQHGNLVHIKDKIDGGR